MLDLCNTGTIFVLYWYLPKGIVRGRPCVPIKLPVKRWFFFFTQQHMDPIFQVSEKGKSSESKFMKNVAFSKTQCG